MKQQTRTHAKRGLALTLALVLTTALAAPAWAEGGDIPVACDEAYYATLDYYGSLTESSVVKSYHTRGARSITDYGVYDDITNLTDDSVPAVSGGQVTFQLGDAAPDTFYFEGKTAQPYDELPWKLTLSYKLNGVPTKAEDLAGKQGVVEIALDAVPDPTAPEYLRNNLVLTASSMFNDDDILSLEAPGAQVQLVGNLRAVLFAVLPGEEQHFVIRVGTDDFTYAGMIFLAVPATLQQLDQVADLKEAKDKAEDSYDAINDSLDVILDTLEGMSGSLNATANGLDSLNAVRGNVSAGKGPVYDSADAALADLDALAEALGPVNGHLDSASQAITDTTDTLTTLTDNAVALKSQLADTRDLVKKLQDDTANLQSMVKLLEDYNDKDTRQLIKNLSSDATGLNDDMEDLSKSLDTLRVALETLKPLSTVKSSELPDITVNAGGVEMTVSELLDKIDDAKAAKTAYAEKVAELKAQGVPDEMIPDFPTFLVMAGLATTPEEAQQLEAQINALLSFAQSDKFKELTQTLQTINGALKPVNTRITEVNKLIQHITEPTADLLLELQTLCDTIGDKGFTDDLQRLTKLCADLMEDMEEYDGDAATLLGHIDDAGDLLTSVSRNADTALDLVKSLDDTLNSYVPDTQQALTDAKILSDTAVTGLGDAKSFFSTLEDLLRSNSDALDAGTQQTLSGLADALRKSTRGLSQTDTIRNAKTTISDLIDDEWDSHAGGENNLLLMDANAKPISLTDQRNDSPQSIQYLMRSQEITKPKADKAETAPQEQTALGTVWSRIKAMFADFWNTITGLFH